METHRGSHPISCIHLHTLVKIGNVVKKKSQFMLVDSDCWWAVVWITDRWLLWPLDHDTSPWSYIYLTRFERLSKNQPKPISKMTCHILLTYADDMSSNAWMPYSLGSELASNWPSSWLRIVSAVWPHSRRQSSYNGPGWYVSQDLFPSLRTPF